MIAICKVTEACPDSASKPTEFFERISLRTSHFASLAIQRTRFALLVAHAQRPKAMKGAELCALRRLWQSWLCWRRLVAGWRTFGRLVEIKGYWFCRGLWRRRKYGWPRRCPGGFHEWR